MSFYSGVVLRVAIESNSWLIAQDEDARLSLAGLEPIVLVLLFGNALQSLDPTRPFRPGLELVAQCVFEIAFALPGSFPIMTKVAAQMVILLGPGTPATQGQH